jgi:Na+/melibiose symporter-like transporter
MVRNAAAALLAVGSAEEQIPLGMTLAYGLPMAHVSPLFTAFGVAEAADLAGLGLQLAGYDAASEVQQLGVQCTMLWLGGGIPALTYGLGLLEFSRFRLDHSEHARVQAEARAMRGSAGDENEAVRS